MNWKSIAIATAVCAGAPAMAATCTSTFSLGTLGPTDVAYFGNNFTSPQSFTDCYSFSLSDAANAFGVTLEWDWSSRLNIDLSSVTLTGTGLSTSITDTTPLIFSFNGLQTGTYQLAFAGNVVDSGSGSTGYGVGYAGLLSTAPSAVTPVPEPETLAMLALGFGAVVWVSRRKA